MNDFTVNWADAELSPCGKYRYRLYRSWDQRAPWMPIIMLNPSTADATQDDPTIRRCISFAQREGCGGIVVVNLFAYRATSPDDLKRTIEPFGADNMEHVRKVLTKANARGDRVLAAWGNHGNHHNMSSYVVGLAEHMGVELYCLGVTSRGEPKHPLYVKGDTPLVTLKEARHG